MPRHSTSPTRKRLPTSGFRRTPRVVELTARLARREHDLVLGGEPLDLLALDQRQVVVRLGALGEVAVSAQARAGDGLDALDLEDGFGVRCGQVDADDL